MTSIENRKISEVSAQRSSLEQLRKDLPELLKQINANPETAKVLEDTLSAALLNGLTETPLNQ